MNIVRAYELASISIIIGLLIMGYPDGFSGERSLHRPEYADRIESGLTDE